jgi:nitroreductase
MDANPDHSILYETIFKRRTVRNYDKTSLDNQVLEKKSDYLSVKQNHYKVKLEDLKLFLQIL